MDEWEERVGNVAHEIKAYLEAHPHAADSLEGIATWWVSRQRIRRELEVVQAALEQLSRTGVVATNKIDAEQGPIYRLNDDIAKPH